MQSVRYVEADFHVSERYWRHSTPTPNSSHFQRFPSFRSGYTHLGALKFTFSLLLDEQEFRLSTYQLCTSYSREAQGLFPYLGSRDGYKKRKSCDVQLKSGNQMTQAAKLSSLS